jgi:kynurenine formamidase
MPLAPDYIKELKKREKKSHVYKEFQLIGLEITDILKDRKHKALYIKLAKTKNAQELLGLAKDVAGRKNIKNKGAYFMAIVTNTAKEPTKQRSEIYRAAPLQVNKKKS